MQNSNRRYLTPLPLNGALIIIDMDLYNAFSEYNSNLPAIPGMSIEGNNRFICVGGKESVIDYPLRELRFKDKRTVIYVEDYDNSDALRMTIIQATIGSDGEVSKENIGNIRMQSILDKGASLHLLLSNMLSNFNSALAFQLYTENGLKNTIGAHHA